ncbi:MAG: hypothetical protein N2749_00535 [Clostridia bacterium]|nr:hypothetical protein [Clostridia bacterium]
MTLFAKKCVELIEAGKLTIEQIINPAVRAEVEQYFAEKEQQSQ